MRLLLNKRKIEMKKMLVLLFTLLLITSSCEEVNQAQFQHAYNGVSQDTSNPDARRTMDTLTNNGRTLPTGAQLSNAVSNPGDCDACNATKNVPAPLISRTFIQPPLRTMIFPVEDVSQ